MPVILNGRTNTFLFLTPLLFRLRTSLQNSWMNQNVTNLSGFVHVSCDCFCSSHCEEFFASNPILENFLLQNCQRGGKQVYRFYSSNCVHESGATALQCQSCPIPIGKMEGNNNMLLQVYYHTLYRLMGGNNKKTFRPVCCFKTSVDCSIVLLLLPLNIHA